MSKRFLLISHVLPPSTSGQAVILQRLLADFSRDECYLLSAQRRRAEGQVGLSLDLPIGTLPTFADTKRMQHGLWVLLDGPLFVIQILVRTKLIIKCIRDEKIECLVVCTGDLGDMVASYLASRMLPKVELIPYYFDYFRFQFAGFFRIFSSMLEKMIMKSAKVVIVPNEFMGKKLEQRYQVSTHLVRNAIPYDKENNSEPESLAIFYAGAIYEAHYDVFQSFIQAVNILTKKYPDLRLNIFTSQEKKVLSENKIEGGSLTINSIKKHTEIITLQKKSALLYLPLAFHTDYPEIIETSCPGKMAEYLNSGVPIFAHIPAGSFVDYYLRKNNAAFCVNSRDPEEVAKSLEEALKNQSRRIEVVASARCCAKLDFSIEQATSHLREIFS